QQAPGDHWIGDDPPDPRHLAHRTGDTTQRQEAEESGIRGKNEPRLVPRLAWNLWQPIHCRTPASLVASAGPPFRTARRGGTRGWPMSGPLIGHARCYPSPAVPVYSIIARGPLRADALCGIVQVVASQV